MKRESMKLTDVREPGSSMVSDAIRCRLEAVEPDAGQPRRASWLALASACLLATVVGAQTVDAGVYVPSAALALDAKHLWALGMIESGNDDREVGDLGEISRYQILPVVWRSYTSSRQWRSSSVAQQVAKLHWARLVDTFRQKARRDPDDFDMYVLWNAGNSYYASKGFNPRRISPVVRSRARRYVNLVNRRGHEEYVSNLQFAAASQAVFVGPFPLNLDTQSLQPVVQPKVE